MTEDATGPERSRKPASFAPMDVVEGTADVCSFFSAVSSVAFALPLCVRCWGTGCGGGGKEGARQSRVHGKLAGGREGVCFNKCVGGGWEMALVLTSSGFCGHPALHALADEAPRVVQILADESSKKSGFKFSVRFARQLEERKSEEEPSGKRQNIEEGKTPQVRHPRFPFPSPLGWKERARECLRL